MTRKQAISFLRTVQPQLIEAIAALSGNPADPDEFMPCDAYHVEYGKPRPMANCSLYLNSTGKVSNGKIQRPENLKKKKKKKMDS